MAKRSHYDVLGVDKKAPKSDIKRAYRRKAKDAHPDAGGNHDEMAALASAWTVLQDDERRKRYDECGDDRPVNSVEQDVRNCLIEAFAQATRMICEDAPTMSVIQFARSYLRGPLDDRAKELNRASLALKRLKSKRDLVTVKEGANWFHHAIDRMISEIEANVERIRLKQEVLTAAVKALDDYEETASTEPEAARYFTFTLGTTGGTAWP